MKSHKSLHDFSHNKFQTVDIFILPCGYCTMEVYLIRYFLIELLHEIQQDGISLVVGTLKVLHGHRELKQWQPQ